MYQSVPLFISCTALYSVPTVLVRTGYEPVRTKNPIPVMQFTIPDAEVQTREERPSRAETGEAWMEDASIFIAEVLLPFSPIPELYPLSGFDC